MPEYRRFKIPAACYFFTVVTYNREPIFTSELAVSCLHNAFQMIRKTHSFKIEGIVLLPNHIHTIWSLPNNDSDYSLRWNLIKNRFTRMYLKHNVQSIRVSSSHKKKREQTIWQRRFWEHLIRNDDDFIKHLDYIHYNPVKHGYVRYPSDWEWSSFHRYVDLGWYDKDWGSREPENIIGECVGE